MTEPAPPPAQLGASGYAGVALAVTDLAVSVDFHRRWLPLLGFRRIGADADRTLFMRRYDHLMLRQADDSRPPAAGITIALAADSRIQVDAVYERLVELGAEVLSAPQEQAYFAPGYYACGVRTPDGLRFEIVHRWTDLPEVPGAERVRLPGADGLTLGGYLFKPEAGRPPYPALVLLHGFGRNAWTERHLAELAAASGYKVLSLALRGWLGSDGDSDQGLHQPDDVVAAIDWLRRLPSVDPGRIGLIGSSMGGQVALLAAARRPAIRCVAALFPPADLEHWYHANPHMQPYLDDLTDVAGLRVRSPIHHVPEIDAPVLLMHGDKDENVPLDQSLRMTEALRAAGKEAELLIVSGASHFFSVRENAIARQRLFAFLRQHLGRR
ncbi:MAG: alpha/beta fold hydrolase [Alphaproteobacteria bacterium]|nr:alpha/beta fold hydrolase [Alphaproteobacteria bacterium]